MSVCLLSSVLCPTSVRPLALPIRPPPYLRQVDAVMKDTSCCDDVDTPSGSIASINKRVTRTALSMKGKYHEGVNLYLPVDTNKRAASRSLRMQITCSGPFGCPLFEQSNRPNLPFLVSLSPSPTSLDNNSDKTFCALTPI